MLGYTWAEAVQTSASALGPVRTETGATPGAVAMAVAAASATLPDRLAFGNVRGVASRQGSYTPQPVSANAPAGGLSPNGGHQGFSGAAFSPPARALRASSPANSHRSSPPATRSYTPAVVHQVGSPTRTAVDDQLSRSLTNLVVPSGMASTGMHEALNGAKQMDLRWHANVSPQPTHRPEETVVDYALFAEVSKEVPPESCHETRVPSAFPLAGRASADTRLPPAVNVNLNVYWQRSVAYDANGRVERRLGNNDLTIGMKLFKDFLGVYHVGVEVHSDEYTFGTYHAPNAKQVGDESSGVCRHEPQKPGPGFVFRQACSMGTTIKSRDQVVDICANLGRQEFGKASYNRIHHNCVDFAKILCKKLGVGEIPSWCYRGAEMAKWVGIGGEPPMQDGGAENASSIANESSVMQGLDSSEPVMGVVVGSASERAYVNTDLHSNAMAAIEQLSLLPNPNQLQAGRCVSVLHSMGSWSTGQIVSKEADGKFTVLYNDTHHTESGIAPQRLVPLPQVPRETTALAQAFYYEEGTATASPVHAATSGRRAFPAEPKLQGQAHQGPCPTTLPPLQGLFTGSGAPASYPPTFLPVHQPMAPPPPQPQPQGQTQAPSQTQAQAQASSQAQAQAQAPLPQRIPAGVASATSAPMRYATTATMAQPVMTSVTPLATTVSRGGLTKMPQQHQPLGVGICHQQKDLNSTWRW